MRIDYHGRRFTSVANSSGGEVDDRTTFHYRQQDDVVWATYQGGQVRFGTLVATVGTDGVLEMRYQHLNDRGEFKSGRCRSTPEVLADGRLRLHERWTWTEAHDGESGASVVEELPTI